MLQGGRKDEKKATSWGFLAKGKVALPLHHLKETEDEGDWEEGRFYRRRGKETE